MGAKTGDDAMQPKHLRTDDDGRHFARVQDGYEILVDGLDEGGMLARGVIFDDDDAGASAEEPGDGPSARIVSEERSETVMATGNPEGDDEGDQDVQYPVHKGGGKWELSDGTTTDKMKRADAEALEAALHEPEDGPEGDDEGTADDDEES